MALYTRTELERCARLAVRYARTLTVGYDALPAEDAVRRAVAEVSQEGPRLHPRDEVLSIAADAIARAQAGEAGRPLDLATRAYYAAVGGAP